MDGECFCLAATNDACECIKPRRDMTPEDIATLKSLGVLELVERVLDQSAPIVKADHMRRRGHRFEQSPGR